MDKNELYKRLNLTPEDRRLDDENFAKVLKAKFRKASLQWHPDKHSGKSEAERKKAEEKFKEIAEAYEVLSDPQKRRQYDTFGTFDANASTMSGADINDIFTRFFDESFFGGRGGQRRGECGTDKSIRIGVTLRELYGGKDKTVRFKKYVPCDACGGTGSRNGGETVCPHCNGSGMITTRKQNGWMVFQSSSTCPHCNGTGTIMKDPCHKCGGQGIVEKEVEITVPVRDIMDCNGQRFMVQGEGNACFRGKGPNGDLYYTYRVIVPDEGFNIEEGQPYNLVADLDVPILTCLTGGEADYRHIDGTLHKVKIERCATDGDRIVVRNLGLPKGYGRGDLIVVVRSVMPRRLTDNDVKLINELKKSPSFRFDYPQ